MTNNFNLKNFKNKINNYFSQKIRLNNDLLKTRAVGARPKAKYNNDISAYGRCQNV